MVSVFEAEGGPGLEHRTLGHEMAAGVDAAVEKKVVIIDGRQVSQKKAIMASALRRALEDPFGNAFLVANLTQLAHDCFTAIQIEGKRVHSVASYYADLPFGNIFLLAEPEHVSADLIVSLAKSCPRLVEETVWGLYSEKVAEQIARFFTVVTTIPQIQMVLKQAEIPDVQIDGSVYRVEPLLANDLVRIAHLYSLVPAMAWTPKMLALGPYFGAFFDDALVSIAGVNFATRWVAEIANVVTHPNHRRHNLAYACTKAVADALRKTSRHIFLCVAADNTPAVALYRKMGFEVWQKLYLTAFRIG